MQTSTSWWLVQPPSALEQGDIFVGVPFLMSNVPVEPLRKTSISGGKMGWMAAPEPKVAKDQKQYFLSSGRVAMGLLLNHGCDIDKPSNRKLTFAAIVPLGDLQDDVRTTIRTQRSIPQFFLPDVPGHGDLVADLRILSTVSRELITLDARAASMAPEAVLRMQAQLLEYFLRRQDLV